MGIVSKVKDKINNYTSNRKKEKIKSDLFRQFQNEFHTARSQYTGLSNFDDREKLYLGTHGVDANVNDTGNRPNGRSKANNVVNVIYELIESQTNIQIPQPSVSCKYQGHTHLERMIEDSIKNDLAESKIRIINDENERITPIQGFSIITVEWNPDIDHHLYRGEIHLDNKHPKCLIPQPGCYDLQSMEYFFIVTSAPASYAERRYGNKKLKFEGEEYPEYGNIDGETDNPSNGTNVSIITRWGKNEDGDIGKCTWVNNEVVEYYDDYFARQVTRCTKCLTVMKTEETIEGEEPCPYCLENLEQEIYTRESSTEDEEMLDDDYTKQDGTVIPAGTKVEYFKPRRYPVILRKNVPIPFFFGGQSDVDVVRDQADAIKKVISTVEEKVLRGGTIIKSLTEHKFSLGNKLFQVVKGTQAELNALSVMDIQSNIQQELEFAQQQYKSAKDTLGITDSFQGKPDSTAQSGVAKQIQVAQSSGRMMSKEANKKESYRELFLTMFEFKLAFYDEVRPYIQMDTAGEPVHGQFNKYEFLVQDASGEWYYNTDFIFSAEAGEGVPKDKMWLMNQTLMYTQSGLMDKVQFWSALEKFGYPGASDYKQAAIQEKQMLEQQQQMMMQQQQEQQQMQQGQMEDETNFKRKLEAAKIAQQNVQAERKQTNSK